MRTFSIGCIPIQGYFNRCEDFSLCISFAGRLFALFAVRIIKRCRVFFFYRSFDSTLDDRKQPRNTREEREEN